MPNLYSLLYQKVTEILFRNRPVKIRFRIRSASWHTLILTMRWHTFHLKWKFNERPEEEELEQWGVEENVVCDELLPGGVHADGAGLLTAARPHTGVHVPPRLQHNTPHQASASGSALKLGLSFEKEVKLKFKSSSKMSFYQSFWLFLTLLLLKLDGRISEKSSNSYRYLPAAAIKICIFATLIVSITVLPLTSYYFT